MASYQKRGKTWQYTISRIINGKPEPIRKGGFTTKTEAKAAAADVESNLNKGIVPHLKPEPFDKYFANWVSVYKKGVGKNTLARYLTTQQTIDEHFAGVAIQSITKRSYQEFLNKYANSHAKDTTRKLNTHIRACVRDAIDEGVIHMDFTRSAILSGSVPPKRPEEKHLNYFESKRMIRALDQPTELSHYLILLGLTSGMRFGEMVGLTRADFNFENNEISVNKTWGYTNKMHEGHGPTKNDKSVRKIKMDTKTMNVFKAWFNTALDNIHKLVFYSSASKYKVLSNGGANKTLENLLKKLNISPISIHGLRHTHASILLYKKVSIYYVSERLGHGDIETTMSHYAHIVKELREQDENSTVAIFGEMAV
ncbi:tyrosine-type recombinase/integrase [Paenibacillus radicis (ex Xue et al. 2023)]|uniref:Site-specific integrase n=1 Tax=Paenibacillus radicis (ex Xue et al. 2023) TaxID=2972489 RepID=A0ABT1YRH8_9BACL|nr:site-specific integrase [Paenibacillus radicis (ex Xue et al. 2023)]MCR8635778.1 site-specific integrase [Paenibacillus radicis (ex Xue et al. 2023)]